MKKPSDSACGFFLMILCGILCCAQAPVLCAEDNDIIFEKTVVNIPAYGYDTILINGEAPAPDIIKFEITLTFNGKELKISPSEFETSPISKTRFWAKFRLKDENGKSFVSYGRPRLRARKTCAGSVQGFIIYEIELFRDQPEKPSVSVTPPAPPSFETELPVKIIPRSEWKAKPPTSEYTRHAPEMITMHHTAAKYTVTLQESLEETLFIQRYHQKGRGWIDIGYHFVIDSTGNILQGRPFEMEGAHVLNHNPGNIGISFLGNYHPPKSDTPTQEQLNALYELAKALVEMYKIPAAKFYAHKDLGETECPGDNIYSRFAEIRKNIFTPAPPPAVKFDIKDIDISNMKSAGNRSFYQLIKTIPNK